MLSNKGDNERRIRCPYDPSHMLLHYRMQTHLVKCRRNHPESKKVTCLFNSTHQVPEPELKYHYEICSDRGNIEKFVYVTEKTDPNRFPIPDLQVQATENWDDEVHPTYNPEEYCRNNPILRNNVIHTQSASIRRNFRIEERQRMQELIDQRTVNQNGNSGHEVQQRRPVGASEGVQNRAELVDTDPFDVANLLARVNLGSSTLTTPRLSAHHTAETEEETSNDNENEILNEGADEPNNAVAAPVPNKSSATENVAAKQHDGEGPNRSTGAILRTHNVNVNESGSQVPNRSTGAVPRVPNRFLDDQDFPQLGAPRSILPCNGANYLSRPVGRGRGAHGARK